VGISAPCYLVRIPVTIVNGSESFPNNSRAARRCLGGPPEAEPRNEIEEPRPLHALLQYEPQSEYLLIIALAMSHSF